jgi:hypothetical protein
MMRAHHRIVALLLLLAIGQPGDAAQRRSKKKPARSKIVYGTVVERWDPDPKSYLYRYTRDLAQIDRIEVVRGHEESSWESFVVEGRAVATGSEAVRIIEAWRALQGGLTGGCWAPGYEAKFYAGDTLVVTARLCFHCQIVAFNRWENRAGFDARGPTGAKLLSVLEEVLQGGHPVGIGAELSHPPEPAQRSLVVPVAAVAPAR